MVSHIPDIDKALAMLMWEAQLFTICAMCEQNPTSSYREIHRTNYLFTFATLSLILIQHWWCQQGHGGQQYDLCLRAALTRNPSLNKRGIG